MNVTSYFAFGLTLKCYLLLKLPTLPFYEDSRSMLRFTEDVPPERREFEFVSLPPRLHEQPFYQKPQYF